MGSGRHFSDYITFFSVEYYLTKVNVLPTPKQWINTFLKMKTKCNLCDLMNDMFQITLKCYILFGQMFWFTKAAHFCFSSCEANRCKHPWTNTFEWFFLLFWLESFCDLKWWPVWSLMSTVPKESKVRVQHVLHGQIQVQADHQNWFHMPTCITPQQIWCEAIPIPLNSMHPETEWLCSIRRVALAHKVFV